jgi:hydrogenase expression/formation protein HypE
MSEHTEIITPAHGDGQGVTLRFIRKEILTRFGNPLLNQLEDGTRIWLGDTRIVVSSDSHIVDPIVFPGGDIGRLAIAGTVNDITACGAVPLYLTLCLILTEGLSLVRIRQILDSAQKCAQEADVQIVAGDTKVLDRIDENGLYINTAGIGIPLRRDRSYSVSEAKPGDCIVVTGTMGDHSLALLSFREGLGFEQRVQSDCAPLNDLVLPLVKEFDGIHCLRDLTRGGLVGALVDVAEASDVDVHIDRNLVPVKREVHFGCEMLGLDPLCLANEGKMLIVVDKEQANCVVSQLRQHPLGIHSQIIGQIQEPRRAKGCLISKQGRRNRVIPRPEGQAIPRLC